MDRELIIRWNNVVEKEDTIYHLGDFGTPEIVKQLNGHKFMVMGNYDREDKALVRVLRPYIGFLSRSEIINVPDGKITLKEDRDGDMVQVGTVPTINLQLVHEPSHAMVLPQKNFVLFAHIHNTQTVKRNGLNVGVDCHNFTPISLETVLFYKNAIEEHYDMEVFVPSVGL